MDTWTFFCPSLWRWILFWLMVWNTECYRIGPNQLNVQYVRGWGTTSSAVGQHRNTPYVLGVVQVILKETLQTFVNGLSDVQTVKGPTTPMTKNVQNTRRQSTFWLLKCKWKNKKEAYHQDGPVTTFVNSTNVTTKGFPVATGVPRTSYAKSLGGSNHPLPALDLVRVLTGLSLDGDLLDIHKNKHSIKELHQATHMGCLTLKDNLGVTIEEGSIHPR